MPDPVSVERDLVALAVRVHRSLMAAVRLTYAGQDVSPALDDMGIAFQSDSTLFTHPVMYDWYGLVRAGGLPLEELRRNWPRVLEEITASRARAAVVARDIGGPFDVENRSAPVLRALDRASTFASESAGADIVLTPADITGEHIRQLAAAAGVLRDLWPEFWAELVRCIEVIVVFEGRAAIGFADFGYHNAIFLRQEYLVGPEVTATSLAEEIIHEASHARLNTPLCLDRFFDNPMDELYDSPLRRDPRPMFGVYHQMFVLRRLKEYYGRLLAALPDEAERWRAETAAIDESLAAALEVVLSHARLTPRGAQLVEAVQGSR